MHAPFWFGAAAVGIGVAVSVADAGVVRRALHAATPPSSPTINSPAIHSPAINSFAEAEVELIGDLA